MDSDAQSNPKSTWKSTTLTFLVCAVLLGGGTLYSKLTNPHADVSSIFYFGLPFVAGLLLLSIVRLKVITILSLLASIVFLAVSFLTKDHNPKLSSINFLSAFFALAGAIVPTLFSQTQNFLYNRGFRGTGVYIDVASTDGGSWNDTGWGGGDCGSGDGGG